MQGRRLALLALVGLLALGALLLAGRPETGGPPQPHLLYPGLEKRINDTALIRVQTPERSFTIGRRDGHWTVDAVHGYAADGSTVRRLLITLVRMRAMEAKTRDPERHARLGVEDPGQPGANSVGLTVEDGSGGILADLIVGERRPSPGRPGNDEGYVRAKGDPQAWLVRPWPRVERDPMRWIDRRIADIPAADIREIEIRHPDGDTLHLLRGPGDEAHFRLQDLAPGETPAAPAVLDAPSHFLENLRLNEVMPESAAPAAMAGATRVLLRTRSGLEVRCRILEQEDRHLLAIEAAAGSTPAASGEAAAGADDPAAAAEALNRRTRGWVYVIPAYKAAAVLKRRADLLQPPAAAEGQGD